MYHSHPSFVSPDGDNERVWRYYDLPKFLDVLVRKQLWFSRPDMLGDAWEGTFSPQWFLDEFFNYADGQWPLTRDQILEYTNQASDRRKNMKAEMATTGVSCWHLCHDESAAMWQVYAASGSGIAIQSTFERLRTSFTPHRHHVFVGKVFYVDHIAEPFPNNIHFEPLLHKRRAFDYEKELRAMTQPYGSLEDIPEPPPPGWHVPVDMNTLIERIVIAPRQQGWFPDLIRSLVDRYELDPTLVHPSTLDLLPPDLG